MNYLEPNARVLIEMCKIHALEILKTQQIRPKNSILTSSSKGGHAPTLSRGEGALTINVLQLLSFLPTFSVGPSYGSEYDWLQNPFKLAKVKIKSR